MSSKLTFIIPVRHQDNAPNWGSLKKNLSETIKSISSQDCDNWNAVIVANSGADLPTVPSQFRIRHVDFPPNTLHQQGRATRENFLDAFRFDKGRRVLAGLLTVDNPSHIMIVDDDDFVSRRLASFVRANFSANGWYIQRGYVWGDGGHLVYRHDNFSSLCGSSHIVNAQLYQIPSNFESANDAYIKNMLGSHIYLEQNLREVGTPLEPLPFLGAVYRTGHAGAHSKSRGILSQFLIRKHLLRDPFEMARRATKFRPLTRALRHEFFGY